MRSDELDGYQVANWMLHTAPLEPNHKSVVKSVRDTHQGLKVGLMLTTLNPRNCRVTSSDSIRKFFLGELKFSAALNH